MDGDGLWIAPGANEGSPPPLALASAALSQALRTLEAGPPVGKPAEQPDGWCILRVEVPAVAPGPRASLLMAWLAAQRGQTPRALFGARDGSLLVAGVGAAHLHRLGADEAPASGDAGSPSSATAFSPTARGGSTGVPLLPVLGDGTDERIRYFGGTRFDSYDAEARRPSEEWEPFGRSYWILPRVELMMAGNNGPQPGTEGFFSSQNSPANSDVASRQCKVGGGSSFGGEGWQIPVTLAVNLRWRPSGGQEDTFEAERSRAMRALQRLGVAGDYAPARGEVVMRREAVPRDTFVDAVNKALEAFKKGDLQKVVLARCAIMDLLSEVDAVDVLHQVLGGTHKRHYLFLLEPEDGSAFVSLTPERLCRVQWPNIWTEAVAGTWPIAEYERIGETALLASSEKNRGEHRLVVDYICDLLREISPLVNVCETHILKLKHLVHIKQSYHAMGGHGVGQAPDWSPMSPCTRRTRPGLPTTSTSPASFSGRSASASPPGTVTTWFCEKMSPTPAVCGLPLNDSRRFICQAEPWDRGFYAAPCGFLNSKGSELMVALRCALLREGRILRAYAGAGVVAGSSPEEEHAEISLKMRQFTEGFPDAPTKFGTVEQRLASLAEAPNLNTLWMACVIEELARSGVTNYVICAGSRSTPLVVAVQRHRLTRFVMNHDERGAAYYAIGWAKAVGKPVAVIVTSGTAVANLLPGVVEAAQSQVPLLLCTADRPAELRDTGANQTVTQVGIFSSYPRWAKDMPPPSTEYPVHALLGDIDLAVAHATGALTQNPGPVHLNFQFRENLAPDGGAVRGAPDRTSAWPPSYIQTAELYRWMERLKPRSTYAAFSPDIGDWAVVDELVRIARSGTGRILVLVGTLRNSKEVLLAEDIALRLQAALFADITSGLRQRSSAVHFADQLLQSPLLAGDVMQLDALVHLGGPCCSARLNAFAKAAAPRLYVRVAPAPIRMDQDHIVTHHLPCVLPALATALLERGLERAEGPPVFWQPLSAAAGDELATGILNSGLSEPFVAYTVSRLLTGRLLISSSMPIRDLDFYALPYSSLLHCPCDPPLANRGASGIDGVISTAVGFCRGSGKSATLVIGDTATLHDLNALQQLTGEDPPELTIVLVNNSGGGIFSFLPIAQHKDNFSPCFDAPHATDFGAACQAFGISYICCESADAFETAYLQSQHKGRAGACIIEARVALSHTENVALHRELGQKVASRVRAELVASARLGWSSQEPSQELADTNGGKASADSLVVLLHGWMGEQRDWSTVGRSLTAAGHRVLAVDLLGHGSCTAGLGSRTDAWEAAVLYSMPMAVEALADLLQQLTRKHGGGSGVLLVGYSLGGRIAMAFADKYPDSCLGTVVLSANPGLRSAVERQSRWKGDVALAQKLLRLESTGFDAFLDKWYSAPIWADLKSRKNEVYAGMLQRRRRTNPGSAAHSLLGLSVAKQQDLWKKVSSGTPMWYAYGELDDKFACVAKELRGALENAEDRVVCFSGAAHALVEECPAEVVALIERAARLVSTAISPAPSLRTPGCVKLANVWSRPIEVALKVPLLLSRGDPMPLRSGVLAILQSDRETGFEGGAPQDALITGIGEICPLPQFHRETLEEAERQLSKVLVAWEANPPTVPMAAARLDGSMARWLKEQCPEGDSLLPSVRSGLEMAILHLLCRAGCLPHLGSCAAGAHGLSCCSRVGVNALVAREEDLGGLCGDGATVVKVKVGKDPVEDAKRVNRCAEILLAECGRGAEARLRLDANQAWSVEEAVTFVAHLSETVASITDYLEEPVCGSDGASLIQSWEAFSSKTNNRVRIAVDESLTENVVNTEHLASCQAPIAALILKPALQGVERTFELAGWATRRGACAVISSAFESGVALAHYTLLAGAMASPPSAPASGVSAFHGLGTFTRLAEDVLQPPFADLISSRHGGWNADTLRCQAALDRTADALFAAGPRRQCQ